MLSGKDEEAPAVPSYAVPKEGRTAVRQYVQKRVRGFVERGEKIR
jgi:hypothetical protein